MEALALPRHTHGTLNTLAMYAHTRHTFPNDRYGSNPPPFPMAPDTVITQGAGAGSISYTPPERVDSLSQRTDSYHSLDQGDAPNLNDDWHRADL